MEKDEFQAIIRKYFIVEKMIFCQIKLFMKKNISWDFTVRVHSIFFKEMSPMRTNVLWKKKKKRRE